MYEITRLLQKEMPVYPGDPPFTRTTGTDGPWRLTTLGLSAHAGTHVDAPAHIVAGGKTIDELPADFYCGPSLVAACSGPVIDAAAIRGLPLSPGLIVLLQTPNGRLWREARFSQEYAALDAGGAQALVALGAKGVGLDYLSVGRHEVDAAVHRILLEAGLAVIEGLDLTAVPPGEYELFCLPMRIAGAEAAPARAVLLPRARGPLLFRPVDARV